MSPKEWQRYARHVSLGGFGQAGQEKLYNASVLCIGAGGLGSPALLYLAAAGVGRLGIVDPDTVSLSNLQRQILHGESTLNQPKTASAASRIADINQHVRVDLHPIRLTGSNALEIARGYDVILDGSDNFATRYLTNDVGFWLGKPVIYGAVQGFEGQVSVFAPHLGGPCYRCMVPQPPPPGSVPSCAEAGILGVLPGIVGLLQATEIIKLLTGLGESLTGRLLHIETLSMRFRDFKLRRDPDCAVCGDVPTITEPMDYDAFAPRLCSTMKDTPTDMTVRELADVLKSPPPHFILLDVREAIEREICAIPGATHIPLGELSARLNELEGATHIAIHCKSGGRSAKAVEICRAAGLENVQNVRGGIQAWAEEIDLQMPKY